MVSKSWRGGEMMRTLLQDLFALLERMAVRDDALEHLAERIARVWGQTG